MSPEYRRMHVASRMLETAIKLLMGRGDVILRTYVEPDNIPSLRLQDTFGFTQKPYEAFDDLLNEGQIMLEKELPLYRAFAAAGNALRTAQD